MPASIYHVATVTGLDESGKEVNSAQWNSAHALTLNAVGSEISGAFTNSGGVTFGYDGTHVTATVATNYQSAGAYLTTAMLSNAATISNINVSAGTTSNNLSALTFSNLNGLAFGLNGSVITGSYSQAAQTNQTVGLYASSNTYLTSSGTVDARSLSFRGDKSITVGVSAGEVVFSVGPYITTAMLSNRGSDFVAATAAFAGTNANGTIASNGISVSVAAQSNQSAIKAFGATNTGNTAGNTGVSTGVDWVIAGTNNITVSQSTAVGGPNTLWLSAPNVAAGNVSFSAGGASAALGSVVFSNSNGVSFGLNGSTITASAAGGGGTGSIYFAGNTTQNSSSTQDYSSVVFGGRGAASVGVSGGSIQISVPATSSLVGTGGISLSTNGSTISISNSPIAMFEPYPLLQSGSTTYAPVAGSWYVQPVYIEQPLSGGRWNVMVAHGSTASVFRATTANFNSNSTGSLSITGSYERRMALYSLGAGTNSTRLESFWSNNFPLSFSHLVGIASGAGVTLTVSAGLTVSCITSIDSNGGSTFSTMGASSTISSNSTALASTAINTIYSSVQNALSSQLMIPIPFNTTINPGAYWIGQMWTTGSGSTSTGTNVATTLVNTFSVVNQYALYGNTNTAARAWLQTAASSGSQPYPGVGVYSAASAVPPTTMAFSDVRTQNSQPLAYINYVNSAI